MPVGSQALLLGSCERVWRSSSLVIEELREWYQVGLMCESERYCCFQKLLKSVSLVGLSAVQLWKCDWTCCLISDGSVISWFGNLMLER